MICQTLTCSYHNIEKFLGVKQQSLTYSRLMDIKSSTKKYFISVHVRGHISNDQSVTSLQIL
jgi:hypothetical protein